MVLPMNPTVSAARKLATAALIEARATRPAKGEKAFYTLRRAAQINGEAFATAYAAQDHATVKAAHIAGHLLTNVADRTTRYAW